ncbi:MAG: dihydropteroate synthase [Bacteroidales bacterium]|nr:dihydropteroate synthase [Bacteroidales bacterium]
MDKDTFFYKKHTIACKGKIINIETPIVMGILNITPDSFFDGGRYLDKDNILARVGKLFAEGATVIDIGAYSSRPGADDVPEKLEIDRLGYALGFIRERFPDAVLSVDTFRAEVASKVINNFGVDIINDISAGAVEPEIIDVVAENGVPYIAMHMQGTPQTMQKNPVYRHVVQDILEYFVDKLSFLRSKGITDIIIDPGFGFGKTLEQNYQLLGGLEAFKMLEVPVLAGLSRKSFIYRLLGTTPDGALTGTIALNLVALQKGASLLRVHDVREAVETISIFKKLTGESEKSLNLLTQL